MEGNLYIKVKQLLLEEWDPIGVNYDDGEGGDEYDNYVPSILKLLEEGADEAEIAKILHHHANVTIGLLTTIDDHKDAASKLVDLIK